MKRALVLGLGIGFPFIEIRCQERVFGLLINDHGFVLISGNIIEIGLLVCSSVGQRI